jgi:hypothetical protein
VKVVVVVVGGAEVRFEDVLVVVGDHRFIDHPAVFE